MGDGRQSNGTRWSVPSGEREEEIGRVLQQVRGYLERHRQPHLERVQALLRQPSVSVEGLGVEACAHLFAEQLRDVGFPEVEVIETDGFPGVWAMYEGDRPTALAVYGMLDVRPADPRKWHLPPFEARLVEGDRFPLTLHARGARAVKGPLGVWLGAVEACTAVLGGPPVNLYVLAETDELLGSPSYRRLFTLYRDRLSTARACWTPGASQDAEATAHLTLGYKGLIYAVLRASGSRWGRGPRQAPMHGMSKSVVDSPVWRLVRALALLAGEDENTHSLGYDNAQWQPPTAEEDDEFHAIVARFSHVPWQRALPTVQDPDVPAMENLIGDEIYRRYFFGPSVNLNGLRAGYIGPGTSPFTLPHLAEAFFDIRVPRTVSVQDVVDRIREQLAAGGFGDIQLDVISAYNGSRTSSQSAIVCAAEQIFASHGVETIRWPASGGGGPWSLFSEELGLPVLRDVGLGHGQAGATDEYLVVEGSGKVGGLIDMALSHVELMLRMTGPTLAAPDASLRPSV